MTESTAPPNAAKVGAQSRGIDPGFTASGARIVWRVQHAVSGLGMYTQAGAPCISGTGGPGRHPAPREDSALVQDRRARDWPVYTAEWERFGFADLRQLRSWLYQDEWFYELAAAGFILAELHVPAESVCIGSCQATYDSRTVLAVHVHELLPTHRYELPRAVNNWGYCYD